MVVTAPVARQVVAKATKPKISTKGDSCFVKHREMVAQVVFQNTPQGKLPIIKFRINPGRQLFPWLSKQAKGWERYKFHSLKFTFHPALGTQNPGNMFFMVDFDVEDDTPTSLQQVMQNAKASQSPIWKQFSVIVRTTSVSIERSNSGPRV